MRYRVWRPEGICLGQAYGKPVWDNRSRGHTLIIMPTQSGKSSGPVATTLLSWPHSTLIFDIKGELHDEITATYRQTLGPVYRWAPTQRDSCGINPFDWIRWGGDFETGDVQRLAVGLSAPGHEVSDLYWHDAAGAFLTGLLVYAKLEGFNSLGGVYEWLNSGDRDDRLKEMLKSPKDAARKAAQAMLNKSERDAAGVWSQVVTSLSLWADPLVRTNTHHSDIHLHDLQHGAGPVSLYVVIPPGDLQRMKTLCRALVESLASVMTDQPVSGTHRPLLLCLDEFGKLPAARQFATALSYLAGYDVRAMMCCQGLYEILNAYGEHNAILENSAVQVYSAPTDSTSKYVSSALGTATIVRATTSSTVSMQGGSTTRSQQHSPRPLMTASELMQMGTESLIVLQTNRRPMRIRKWTCGTEAAIRPHLPLIARESAAWPPHIPWRHQIRPRPDILPSSSPPHGH
jgi:type IV secretion system protein VirD4